MSWRRAIFFRRGGERFFEFNISGFDVGDEVWEDVNAAEPENGLNRRENN